jgi:hypothetical protein
VEHRPHPAWWHRILHAVGDKAGKRARCGLWMEMTGQHFSWV